MVSRGFSGDSCTYRLHRLLSDLATECRRHKVDLATECRRHKVAKSLSNQARGVQPACTYYYEYTKFKNQLDK